MTLGERVKALRKERNLTQAKLSETTGLQTATICHVERNIILPSYQTMEKLAKGFNLSIIQLLACDGMALPGEIASLDDKASKIVTIYSRLPIGDRYVLLKFAEFLEREQEECQPPSNNGKH